MSEEPNAPTEPEIQFIQAEFSHVTVEGGDVLVLSVPGRLSVEMYERLIKCIQIAFCFPRCVILEEGMKIGVVKAGGE